MTFGVLAALLAVGLLIGFLSGLIGIGGGVLMVPLLYLFYAHASWSGMAVAAELEAAVAHATSLAVIVPTGLAAAVSYHRSGLVAWRAALPIAAVAMVAAFAGAQVALLLPAAALKMLFGVLLIGSGANLARQGKSVAREKLRLSWPIVLLTGAAVGLLSALLGVGGGILAIPMLVYLVGLDLRRVAATSIAIVALTASSGTVAYIVSGLDVAGRPPGSLGYVHLTAALPILGASLLTVHAGAMVNQRLQARMLRFLFAAVFLLLGVRLILMNAGQIF